VRVVRRRDVVEDHRRRVMVDEVDQIEVALLHVGNVPRDRLKSFGLQRRAQELDGIVARVEHSDRGLAPGTSSTHYASVLVGLDSPATPAAVVNCGGKLRRAYRAEPAMSSGALLGAAGSPGAPEHARDDSDQLGGIHRLGYMDVEPRS